MQISKLYGLLSAAGMLFSGVVLGQVPSIDKAPPVSGLIVDHATLSVESIPVEAEWYERVLGFKGLCKDQRRSAHE